MEINRNKISFDFDYTLNTPAIQEIAKTYIQCGYEIWITTSRKFHGSGGGWAQHSNVDLFQVADELGITFDRIIFTNLEPKFTFIKDQGFFCHYDDDHEEIDGINKYTDTIGILVEVVKSCRGQIYKLSGCGKCSKCQIELQKIRQWLADDKANWVNSNPGYATMCIRILKQHGDK